MNRFLPGLTHIHMEGTQTVEIRRSIGRRHQVTNPQHCRLSPEQRFDLRYLREGPVRRSL